MQLGILLEPCKNGRYLTFDLDIDHIDQLKPTLTQLAEIADGKDMVVGIGHIILAHLNKHIGGFEAFPIYEKSLIDTPVIPAALWVWLRHDDQGVLIRRAHKLKQTLAPVFIPKTETVAFMHHNGTSDNRDLSGYIDGTENPDIEEAPAIVELRQRGAGIDGSCFVAVQQWLHDLDKLGKLFAHKQMDEIIGRRLSDNQQLENMPLFSHVSRTDQESFTPMAHIFRQSMPWSDGDRSGLMFCAFTNHQRQFNVQWQRMLGLEDGITDGLFKFTKTISNTYFWCPPVKDKKLDLSFLLTD